MKIVYIYLIVINLIGFTIMYIDKKRAINSEYRISEKRIFSICILGGSFGVLIGMNIFRHKTKHKKFVIGVPILLLINVIFIIYLFLKVY